MSVRVLQVMALAAFFCVSVAHAGSLSKASSGVPYRSNGKTATIGEGSQMSAPSSSIPSGSAQIGQSGWYYGTGAASAPSSGQTMNMGANGDVFFSGVKYPFQAGYNVPVADLASIAIGMLPVGRAAAGAVALIQLLDRAPAIKEWFRNAGVQPNPKATGDSDHYLFGGEDYCSADCYFWYWPNLDKAFPSIRAVCQYGADVIWERPLTGINVDRCIIGGSSFGPMVRGDSRRPDDMLPASMADIEPYLLRALFPPAVVNDIINNGGHIPLGTPTVTGPAQIVGEPKTTTSTGTQVVNGQTVPTKTTTTEQTTYNFTTNNNQVTNTTNTTTSTTTTVNQASGAVIGSAIASTETTPEEKDDRSECEKNPHQLNCAELDTPDGEIPRKQIDVSWSPLDLGLGSGSCPAPVQIYENKQFSYQLACDNLYLIKPMVIAIALFVGGMIIFGGRADQ